MDRFRIMVLRKQRSFAVRHPKNTGKPRTGKAAPAKAAPAKGKGKK